MKHTWNTIEEQQSTSNGKIQKLFQTSEKSSFFSQHAKAMGAAVFGITLLSLSFMDTGSFQANLLNPTDFVTEAEEFDVTPINLPVMENLDTLIASEKPDPFASPAPTETIPVEAQPLVPEPTEAPAEEINPFLSLVNRDEFQPVATDETFHSASEIVMEDTTEEPAETSVVPTVTEAPSAIEENPYTYNTEASVSTNTLGDPLEEERLFENFNSGEEVKEETPEIKTTDSTFFEGTLQAGTPKTGSKFQYGFQLERENDTPLTIYTYRDLRPLLGKELKIEVDGNAEKFELLHVYPKGYKRTLPQSGPASTLSFFLMFSAGMAYFMRRRG
ncbi:hypothetical protein COB57_04725 [Candidatus Peregrinibacteria bacterium]|nr:MAG: hypothetical protein COB57_04725 [Candidatus Peregrinibacteria bacterium]